MLLKIIIIILFIGVVVSLTSGLIFLLKDIESPTKRTVYALGIRIGLASLLMMTIFYGLYSGQLGSSAPWDIKLTKEQVQQKMEN